jgi:hypothetical protein
MADYALENAKSKREQLLAQMKDLQRQRDAVSAELDRVDRFIHDWHEFAGGTAPVNYEEGEQSGNNAGESNSRRSRVKNPKKEDVAEAARAIIQERGGPIMREELYALLADRGIHIQGKDPQMVLSTMLWRMKDRVVRLGGDGYWLREVPYEPAQYHPAFDELIGAADEAEPPKPDDYDDD